MRKLIYILISISAISCLSGCVNFSEEITLNKDGSGSADVRYSVFVDDNGSNLEAERAAFTDGLNYDGVTVVEASVSDEDSTRTYSSNFEFPSSDALNQLSIYRGLCTTTVTTRKKLQYRRVINLADPMFDYDAEQADKLSFMFSENLFTFKLTMPGDVISSNGEVLQDNRTIIWSYTLGEILVADKDIELVAECK